MSARGRSGQWHLKLVYWGLKVLAALHGGIDCSSCKCRLKNLISQLCCTAVDTSRLKASLCMAKTQIHADWCHGLAPATSLAPTATAPPVEWESQLEGQKCENLWVEVKIIL